MMYRGGRKIFQADIRDADICPGDVDAASVRAQMFGAKVGDGVGCEIFLLAGNRREPSSLVEEIVSLHAGIIQFAALWFRASALQDDGGGVSIGVSGNDCALSVDVWNGTGRSHRATALRVNREGLRVALRSCG